MINPLGLDLIKLYFPLEQEIYIPPAKERGFNIYTTSNRLIIKLNPNTYTDNMNLKALSIAKLWSIIL